MTAHLQVLSSGTLAHRGVTVILRVLPSQVKHLWKHPHTHQDVCLLGDSNPVKLTMKTNYHKAGGKYLE